MYAAKARETALLARAQIRYYANPLPKRVPCALLQMENIFRLRSPNYSSPLQMRHLPWRHLVLYVARTPSFSSAPCHLNPGSCSKTAEQQRAISLCLVHIWKYPREAIHSGHTGVQQRLLAGPRPL